VDEGSRPPRVRGSLRRPEGDSRYLVIPDWQREILRERLEDLERNPDDEQPWEEVAAEIRPRKGPPRETAP